MTNPYNKIVGKKIHDARKAKRMSMKELGKMVGLHESTVSRYEKGEIKALDIETLKEFAKALEVSSAYLTGWDENAKSETHYEKLKKMKLTDKELDMLLDYANYIISKRE